MAAALPAWINDVVLGLKLGSIAQETSNRFSIDGLGLGAEQGGAFEIGVRRLEATSLRLASGPLVLEVGRLALHQLVGQVRTEGGRPRLCELQAANAELSGLKVHGPLTLSRLPGKDLQASQARAGAPASAANGTAAEAGGNAWSLAPLGAAEGGIRAKIIDAHLLFDADVTVPIRQGQVNFNEATVAHVGPDSRMGISRLGLYVDAPNGRSYLYQFPSTPVGGVEYERRGALPGPWASDRGKLRLQEFGEGLLRQARVGQGLGFTEQARLLFGRTALSGDVQLGDGRFAMPGVQADLTGRAQGRNAVRLHSEAVGRGLTLEMPSLSVRQAVSNASVMQLACAELTAAILLRLFVEGAQLRFAFELANAQVTGLRLHLRRVPDA